jgi:ketosteroid isomerase-like protein
VPELFVRTSPIVASCASGFDPNGIALLLVRFSNAVDRKQAREVAEQFAPDGMFKPADTPVEGRAAIEALYRARFQDPRRTTRHLWGNLLVLPQADGTAHVDVVLTIYAFEPAVSEDELQMRIGNVWARCVRDGQGVWRFAEHVYEKCFAARLPGAAVAPARK